MKTFSLILSLALISPAIAGTADKAALLKQLIETRACVACQLEDIDLSGLNLSGVNLSGANLNGSKLHQTNLRGANLEGASMLRVLLSDTALAGANLSNADFSDLDIDHVFEYVEIIGTRFEGAKFKNGVVCGPAPDKGGWGCQQQ